MASPRGACLSTRTATCLGFANPDGFILPPGLWPNNILAGNSWPDVDTALALARPTLNLSETPGPRKSLMALDFQGDAGTRAPVNGPSILLLCSSLFVGLLQHLSGSSHPARRAESCSQALDCCAPAGSTALPGCSGSGSPLSIRHPLTTSSLTWLQSEPHPPLSSPGTRCLAQHLKFSVSKMFWDHTITSSAKT